MTTFAKCAFWAILAGCIIGGSAQLRAHADPQDAEYVVCGALGSNPTIGNVTRVLETIEAGGVSDRDAAGIVVTSVKTTCPRYLPLLQLYIDTYLPQPSPVRQAPVPTFGNGGVIA